MREKMPYKVKTLPSFSRSAFEADSTLYALSPKAADKYFEDYNHKTDLIRDNPKMFQIFEDDSYFRSAPLAYGYRLFYHVDDQKKIIVFHRVIHGAMDLVKQLRVPESD